LLTTLFSLNNILEVESFAMEFHLSKSEKDKDVLRLAGHEYLLHRRRLDDVKEWRCRQFNKFKCPSRLHTSGAQVIKQATEHSHSADPVQAEARATMAALRQEASISQATTRSIVAQVLQTTSNDVLSRLPKRTDVERNTRRVRQRANTMLGHPQSINFLIPQEYSDIILYDSGLDDPHRILIIGSNDLLPYLERGETWFGDGTFKVVPSLFFQLYSLHAKVGNSYPPLIYCLLPNKTGETYRKMIAAIKRLLPASNPQKVLLDFEMAAMSAFRDEFPEAEISGCFFHLSQSIIRKVNELGLKAEFEAEDGDFNIKVKSLASLAFVPPAEVNARYDELAQIFPDDDSSNQLLSYFEHTYVRGPGVGGRFRNARFPPEVWSHYADALASAPKTTNCCEGFHNALQSLFMCAHPTVWKLFRGLISDMAIHRLTAQNAEVLNVELPRSKYAQLADRLREKVADYHNQGDKLRYLRAISNMQAR